MSSQSHSKDVANELIEKIHTWIQFQKEAAQKLEKLASEVEKNYRNVNISKVVGSSVSTVGALSMVGAGVLTFLTAGLASPLLVGIGIVGIGATVAGLVTNVASDVTELILSSKTTEETKEISEKIEKLEKEICDLIDSLKEEEKKREEQTGSFNVPCENRVLDRIFGAIAKIYGLDFHYSKSLSSIASMSGGSKALLIGISALSSFVVRKGCKTIAKTALSRGLYFTIGATAAKGLGRVGGGAVGLGFSIYDLVKSSTNVNNPETDVSKALREYATDIRRAAGKLDGEFDQIQETFKMLAKVKVGLEKFERSPNDKKTLVESAIENCKDEDAVQWLKTNSQHEALAKLIEWSKLI